ncbi:hypothetical protein [Streptomyces sp. NBC_01198]|uniref:hypothetical protein n=1 Tax=Streptomyces sp. NBC_01198 TaxID=2903769 RepID=UPI003FA3593F
MSPESKAAFEPLGESLAELSKFAALLVFRSLLTPSLFGDLPVGGYVAVVLAIVLIRPASLRVSPAGTSINQREKLTADAAEPETDAGGDGLDVGETSGEARVSMPAARREETGDARS